MLADIRYALRGFLRSPGFTLVAILSVALGIGANTAIFSLVNAILLRTLPVRDPGRLVLLTFRFPDRFALNNISETLYEQIRDTNTTLDQFAAITGLDPVLSDGRSAELVDGVRVSTNFFQALGVNSVIGRAFTPADGDGVCLISHGLWRRRFGGQSDVIGRRILVSTRPFTILGVAPAEFRGFTNSGQNDLYCTGIERNAGVLAFGRLKSGVSIAQAQAELDALFHRFAATLPPRGAKLADQRVILEPGGRGSTDQVQAYEKPLLMLLAVTGLVLLIVCANVANLLMARTAGRGKEIAVRLALGAGRGRLVRQLLAESLLLAIAGAVLGIAIAAWADRALIRLVPARFGGGRLTLDVNPDVRVLLFTLSVVIVVTLLAGIAPAIQGTRPDTAPALKGETGVRAPGRFSLTRALMVGQIASSLVLLIGAGLFLRSLRNLKSVDPGLDPERLIVLTLQPSTSGYSPAASQRFFATVVEQARSLPGVIAASPGLISPLSSEFSMTRIAVSGHEPSNISVNSIGPDYFRTLETPLIAGRAFNDRDEKVVIVNEKMATHFWPHENPIGKRVSLGPKGSGEVEVIGVVKNVRSESLREDAPATVYMPFRVNQRPHMTLHVRVSGDTAPVIAALIAEIRTLDGNVPVYNASTMAAQIDRTLALDRLMALLTALFGVLAVSVAAIGLYGVMAFIVAARTREIGIRMALGATQVRVLGHLLSESAALVLIGVAVGIPAALGASRTIRSFLYGLTPTDPWTYAALAAVFAAIALSAAWIPASRAAGVDPMVALRYE